MGVGRDYTNGRGPPEANCAIMSCHTKQCHRSNACHIMQIDSSCKARNAHNVYLATKHTHTQLTKTHQERMVADSDLLYMAIVLDQIRTYTAGWLGNMDTSLTGVTYPCIHMHVCTHVCTYTCMHAHTWGGNQLVILTSFTWQLHTHITNTQTHTHLHKYIHTPLIKNTKRLPQLVIPTSRD